MESLSSMLQACGSLTFQVIVFSFFMGSLFSIFVLSFMEMLQTWRGKKKDS